jgi:citrate lyase synthetase
MGINQKYKGFSLHYLNNSLLQTLNSILGESMKVLGIIAEYNPFHNGHLYHLRESIKKTHAD